MKMKKEIKKAFRRARRNVCRYIIGFDACPEGCRKNYKQIAINVAYGLSFVVVTTLFFSVVVLFFS
jgi:hypothetical protein